MSDSNTEGKTVDPVEFGKLYGAVENLNQRLSHFAELEAGLRHANTDILFLKETQTRIIAQQEEMIRQMKHLNGADKKLETLGFRLEDAKEHRKDQLYLRTTRRAAEKRHESWGKVKTGVATAIVLTATIWILSTLWQARHTLSF